MSKEIKVKIISSTKLELAEQASVGDFIDLEKIKNCPIDDSSIDNYIKNLKEPSFEKEVKRHVEAIVKSETEKISTPLKNEIVKLESKIELAKKEGSEQKAKETFEIINKLNIELTEMKLKNSSLEENYKKDAEINSLKNKKNVDDLKKEIDTLKSKNKWDKYQNWDRFSDGGLENDISNKLDAILAYYPNAKFEKDNTKVDEDGIKSTTGTKGDFIYVEKNPEDGFEFTISFECKNEKINTKSKKKILDHYHQADMNRKKKKCKYSVIITTMEPELEFTIKLVKEYDDMYVIRPEWLECIMIQLRRTEYNVFNATKDINRQLIQAKNTSTDIENFEDKLNKIKENWKKHFEKAGEKFDKSIDEIDKTISSLQQTIKHLQNTKDYMINSKGELSKSDDVITDISIKKLTHGNPTVKKLLEDNRKEIINEKEKKE
ncbi:MAG: DUF2130 domain-containing protein [Mycoplasmataceae bacterium]|nr:DUF2130 domain-containing protein [Mycoplasmataceae bacterium]